MYGGAQMAFKKSCMSAALAACVLVTACNTLTLQPTGSQPLNGTDVTMGTYSSARDERYIIVTMTDGVFERLARGEPVDKEADLPPLYADFLGHLARTYGLKRVADWPLDSLDIRCLVFELLDAGQRDATIAALTKEEFVETVQPVNGFSASGGTFVAPAGIDIGAAGYNDPYSSMQPALQEMQIAEAHRWATGRGVRVAVIDTGIDVQHPELRERIFGVRNFVDRDASAFNADVHGTAVAGVIAASANNGIGFVGVAPEAQLVGLKACWYAERSSRAHCNSFTLAKALNFAIGQQVDIINLSLGGPLDPLLARLVAMALERGVLVIGAVHPQWPNGFPAAVENVIAVTRSELREDDDIGTILAPGGQILSAKPNDDYDFYTGSSFAAAQISGVAALMRQLKPDLSSRFVKEAILASSPDGRGTANACRALARIVADLDCRAAVLTRVSQ
jgi:subtilisin family serine protease